MSNSHGAPRRVSLGYILGFSDKPFKDPKPPIPPPPPPRPKKPCPLTELITTPGGLVEWTASDGRKGTLTGKGKSRLTAASLAKIPSERRSTKELLGVKDTSKKSASNKPDNADEVVASGGSGGIEATSGSKKSGSKKSSSKKGDASGGSNKVPPVATGGGATVQDSGAQTDAPGGDKKDEKKDANATEKPTTSGDVKETLAKNTVTAENGKENGDEQSGTWTKEQDEMIVQIKAENPSAPWAGIAEKVGKTVAECKERWGEIKPKSGQPNNVNNAGTGDAGKKKNKKGNQNQNQEGKGDEKKADENKDEKKKAEEKKVEERKAEDQKAEETKEEENVGELWGVWGEFGGEDDDNKPDDAAKGDNTNTGGAATDKGWDSDDTKGNANNGSTKDAWVIDNNTEWNGDATNTGGTGTWNNTATKDDNNGDVADSWDVVDGGAGASWEVTVDQTSGNANGNAQPDTANAWPSVPNPPSEPQSNHALPTTWDTGNMQTNNNTAAGNAQPPPTQENQNAAKPPSAPRSNKAPSEARSHRSSASKSKSKSTTSTRPLELELTPDDTFSADDLRLIARILQQDCKMVWDRVSWRFRDKTGRIVEPDVFERKITGGVEGEEKEKEKK